MNDLLCQIDQKVIPIMSTQNMQNYQFINTQISDIMKACQASFKETGKIGMKDSQNKLDNLYSQLLDLQDEFSIYTSAVMEAGDNDDYDTVLENTAATLITRSRYLSVHKEAMMKQFRTGATETTAGVEDEDDIQFEGGEVGLKCPLTTRLPTHPVISNICHHVFEKDAIINYIRQNGGHQRTGRCQCPVAGCNTFISIDSIVEDKVITAKVNEARRKEQNDWEALD